MRNTAAPTLHMNTPPVTLAFAGGILARCIDNPLASVPVFWGDPGIGKTAMVRQVAAAANEASKQAGEGSIPLIVVSDVALSGATRLMEHLRNAFWQHKRGILLLDDLTRLATSLPVSAIRQICERRISSFDGDEIEVPEGWTVCATASTAQMNAPTVETQDTRAGLNVNITAPSTSPVQETLDALVGIIQNVKIVPDVDEWIRWALKTAAIGPEVISFVKMHPQLLCGYRDGCDGRDGNGSLVLPTPRGWERVARLYAVLRASGRLDTGRGEHEFISATSGIVGEAAAAEFVYTMGEIERLPNPRDLMGLPRAQIVRALPTDVSALYALVYALPAQVTDKESAFKALEVILALGDLTDHAGVRAAVEFQVLATQALIERVEKIDRSLMQALAQHPGMADLLAKYTGMLGR